MTACPTAAVPRPVCVPEAIQAVLATNSSADTLQRVLP
jgi:hypothetical protein